MRLELLANCEKPLCLVLYLLELTTEQRNFCRAQCPLKFNGELENEEGWALEFQMYEQSEEISFAEKEVKLERFASFLKEILLL